MASDIFGNIIEQKIDIFASTFGDGARNIFIKDKKLIHPLEYGMYRERCARELLECTTNKSVGIADGFLISTNNDVSTQCDIIMYQKDTLPLIDNGITNFFPVEIVKGIGEIKSNLTVDKFKEALLKLAKNKKMFLERKGAPKNVLTKEFDEIFSFLICNKFDFDMGSVNFDDVYAGEQDLRMRHNLILSLQDGLFLYGMIPDELPTKEKQLYAKKGNLECQFRWPYPHHSQQDEMYQTHSYGLPMDESDKYEHIKQFLVNLAILTTHQIEHKIDILQYLTDDYISILKKESIQ